MVVRRNAVLFVIVAILAGCLDPSTPAAPGPSSSAPPVRASDDAPIPEPTETTGAMAVLVVNTEHEPVPVASVYLQGTELRAHTDSAGRATFNGLDPGAYTVLASKPGYRALQDRGKVVEVQVLEVTSVTLTLDPLALVSKDTSYSRVAPFKGFIACSYLVRFVDSGVPAAQSLPCGRGLYYQGTQVVPADANENTTHSWAVENVQVQAFLLEATWQPSQETLGSMLTSRMYQKASCSGTNCNYERLIATNMSRSPLVAKVVEGSDRYITRYLGSDGTKYPQSMIADFRVWCQPAPCQALMVNQQYQAYMSSFYGRAPSSDYSMLPK